MAATATATATVTVALAKLVLDQMERMEQKQNQKQQKQKQAIVTMQQDVIAVKDELEATQAFLKDMKGSSQGQSHMLKSYVRLVRDLAYDGEDCLQEFLIFLEQPPRAKASPKLVLTQEVISTMLKNLRIKVDSTRAKLRYCADAAGLTGQTGSGIVTLPLSRINSVAYGKAPLIGREMERSHLIKLISQQWDQCRVISIWGMVGIGKTALTKSVYESRELGLMFEKGAWVSVMRPFNLDDVLKSLYWQLKIGKFGALGQPLESSSPKSEELMKPLNDIRCMIVLDGVLSIEEWKLIKPYLLATNARRIIVTTRELSVAEHCSTAYKNIYKLQSLDDAAALELFKSKVFMETSVWDLHPDISAEAELILKECDGHPLTIASIGELLSSKPFTAIEWSKLNDHLKAGFESTPSLQLIRKALSPTYDDLPYHLQLCVLYLSIFPKGDNIRRRRLIARWIAEGYSCKSHNKSAEEIGEGYFQELINRGVIRPSKTMSSNVERIDYFQVNNLHHKLSVSEAMEENHGFVLGSTYNNQDTRRHIVIMSSESDRINLEKNDLSHVRSLTVFGVWRTNFISSKMRLLRVLDFEGTSGLQDDDLKHIGDFLHLRYLSVRGCVDICNLPNSVGNLSDLQMLDTSGTHIIKLPNTITKLKKLQYIRAGNIPLPPNDHTTSLSKSISEGAQEAVADTKMPEVKAQTVQFSTAVWDFTVAYCNSLVSSATPGLDMHGVEVPNGIGKLDALHTFSVVNVSAGKAMLTELEKLTQLQKLGVTGINMENSQNVLSTIGNLTLLISLSIRSEGKPGLHGCLDHTFSPPIHLQSLKLYGYLLTLPTWINQLKNLAKLKLQSTRLEYDIAMKVLEKLPHLAILRLWMKSFQDEELSFHFQQQTFPSLTVLELADQDGIKSIKIDEGAMPSLEILQIKDCKDLGNGIFTGMSFPPNLKEVVLNGIYEDNFMEHLSTELVLNPKKPNLRWT